jgi:hypothetical protein
MSMVLANPNCKAGLVVALPPYLGGLICHFDSVLKDVDREARAGIARHPEPVCVYLCA